MEKIPTTIIEQSEVLSDSETKELLRKVDRGDKEAKDKLVESNLRLVLKIAHRYKNSQYALEDIFQIGTIGLIKAIDGFDLTKEVKFSTYAVPKIIGEIKMFLRDDHPVKVSRSLKEKAQKIIKLKEKLTKDLNREPTIQELSAEINLTCEEIVNALEAVQNPTSIYNSTLQEEDDLELVDQLGDLEREYATSLNKLFLQQVLAEFKERKKRIFQLRFVANKSQSEVADIIGVSQAHISRLENQILEFIKQKLE